MMRSLASVCLWLLALIFSAACPASAGERLKIVVGGDYENPPYEFLDNGRPAGFNVELMRAVAEATGMEAEFKLGPWKKLRNELEKGKIAALAGMYHSTERSRQVDFSVPHTIVSAGLFVARGSPIRSFDDIKGKEIIVQKGDIIDDYLREKGITSRIIETSDPKDVLILLASGRHDCALMPSRFQGEYLKRSLGLSNIRAIAVNLPQFSYCFAVQKGNGSLMYRLDEGLNILKLNGKYREIYEKWFGVYEKRDLWDSVKFYVLAIALVAALCLVFMVWTRMLKRVVEQRTAELENELAERRQVEEKLRFTQYAIDNSADYAFWMTEDGHLFYVNDAACRALEYSRQELLQMSIPDIDPYYPPEAFAEYWRYLRERGSVTHESYHRAKDGRVYPVEIHDNLVVFDGKEYNCAFITDISERKRAEDSLRRLNRELLAISSCNKTLMRAEDEQTLLNDICRIICDEAGYRMAWVGYAENDDVKSVRPVAWAGVEDGYLANAAISWADTERGRGPTGTSIRSGECVCFQDFSTEPHAALWRDSALARGYSSNIALPLKDENAHPFGALTIYSTEPNAFTSDEKRLLGELADDLAFGISFLRTRMERRRMSQELERARDELEKRVEERTAELRNANGLLGHEVATRMRNESVIMARLRLIRYAETHSLDELLEATLDEAENLTGSMIGFYVFVLEDQNTMSLQNWSSRTKRDYCKVEWKGLLYDLAKSGVWTDCFHQRRPVIHNDYASLPHRKGLPPGHAPLIRELVVPVFRGEKIVAVLAVGNKATDYTSEDVETASLLADLAWEITERKQAEEALLLSQFCIDKAAIGIYHTTHEGDILSANDFACHSLGYTSDELLALKIQDIDPVITREKMLEIKRMLDSDGSATHESVHRRRDGTTFPVEIVTNALEFQGKSYSFSFVKDITERKRANAELALTQFLVDKASIGIHRVSEEGNITYVNEFFCQSLGYTREELCSMTVFEIDPTFNPDTLREHRNTSRNAGSRTFESIHRRKDGSTFPVEILVSFLEYQDNEIAVSFAKDITERKRTEQALREANLVVENSPVVLFRWKAEDQWPVELVSANIIQFGYTPDEFLTGAITYSSIIHPEDLERVSREVRNFCAEGEDQFRLEYRIMTKGQDVRWINEHTNVERNESGCISNFQGIVIDVTERKRIENINMARLRLLQLSATGNLDDLLEATLNEAEALTGSLVGFFHFLEADQETLSLQSWSTRTKAEFCGAKGKGLHYDVSAAGVWADCIRERRPVIHNDYASLPDRKGMPPEHAQVVREMVLPVFRGHNLVAIIGVGNKPSDYTSQDVEAVSLLANLAWEITERLRIEEELRKANLVVENSPVVLFRCKAAPGWPVELVSRNVILFGYTPEEFLSGEITYSSIVFPQDLERVNLEMEEYCASGEGQLLQEYRIVTKGGDVRWIIDETVCERNEAEKITHYDGVIIDVTERKLAEEELQRKKQLLEELNRTLEERVREEVVKNREKDVMLIQQNRQAALGESLDHIAHQWKQPLNIISLITWLLKDNESLNTQEVTETADKILAQVDHMSQTLDVFRDFYRPDKEKSVFPIKEGIEKAISFIMPALKIEFVRVELEADPAVAALGYPKEFAQVIINLVSNARDAFRERRVERRRLVIKAFGEENRAVVTVTDNAGGISAGNIASIFDMNFTTKELSGGTGIGLYMSKNIIERHMGGILTAENVADGARFTIILPMPAQAVEDNYQEAIANVESLIQSVD